MINMRFKNFIWPNNPYTCSLTTQRQTVPHKFAGGGYYLEDLGKGLRVLSGNGEFFGERAYGYMLELLQVFEEGGTGRLLHPVLQFKQAVFTELELLQEPREDYVLYRFTFCEDDSENMGASATGGTSEKHVVQSGENLWEIAAMYGSTADILLAANSWIENPNALTVGGVVMIP